jgi:hypothetical protein
VDILILPAYQQRTRLVCCLRETTPENRGRCEGEGDGATQAK